MKLPRNKPTRLPRDGYQTPTETIRALLSVWSPPKKGLILEPCSGKKLRIVTELESRCVSRGVVHSDIIMGEKYDFLAPGYMKVLRAKYHQTTARIACVVTNPPFSLALEFVRKSLEIVETGDVVMLLRVNWLGSQKRHAFWRAVGLTSMVILSDRPSFVGGGTDMTEYAWFIWSRENGEPLDAAQRGIEPFYWVRSKI